MNKMRIYIAIVANVLVLACQKNTDKTQETATSESANASEQPQVMVSAEQAQHLALPTGNFVIKQLSENITANGKVEVPPQQMISLSVPINGFIKNISLLPGTPVRKGQVLATVQSIEYVQLQQEYLQALSQNAFQAQDLNRQETLNQENVGSKKKLQQIDADFKTTKALINGLEEKLKLIGCNLAQLRQGHITPTIQVLSPITGYTKMVYVNNGKNIAPSDVLVELVSREHLHLELNVFEKDANKVQLNQTLYLENPVLSDKPVTGKVILIGQTIEGQAKAILVHGHLDNEILEQKLVVGQYVNTKIKVGSRAVPTLPEEAIVRRGEGGFIFVQIKTNTYQAVPVKLGVAENGFVEIISEKTVTQPIVLKNASILFALMSGGEE